MIRKKLEGNKFGRLMVLEVSGTTKNGKTTYECKCECGTFVNVIGSHLVNGNTKSCGCLKMEIALSKKNYKRKYNQYDLSGEFGVGFTTKGEAFYFDLEDYDLIKDYCWRIHHGYVETSFRKNTINNNIYFHRLILPDFSYPEFVVDHINRNERDNRKINLRIVRQSENSRNQSVPENNKTGVIGVEETSTGRWKACIRINGKRKSKTFVNFDDAVRQRYQWEDENGFISERLYVPN